MSEPKRPLKVFLCHAHADRDSVRGLYARLTQDGVDAWFDKAKLLPGQDWELEIRKAVREADVVVVCLSKQFSQKGFKQKEVKWALDEAELQPESAIYIIPARLEECDTLESLRKWHWVDYFEDDGYEKLIKTLEARAKEIETLPPSSNTVQSTALLRKIIPLVFIMFLLIGILLTSGLIRSLPIIKYYLAVPTPTITFVPSVTIPALIETVTIELPNTSTITALPTEIIDANGVKMVLVSAGEFIMGAENGASNELPVHKVYLNSFYIDKTEVTNAMYKLCVDTRVCSLPSNEEFYRKANYIDYPVVYVSWNDAKKYCEWAGQRLPTEAEWEKAARGTDGRTYPWGNGIDCRKANYGSCFGSMRSVGFYTDVPSPYGALDMVGNAWEWVSDWYGELYYANSPYENPQGPIDGEFHSLRGGSWETSAAGVSSFNRGYENKPLDYSNYKIGFRCVLTP